MADLKQFLIEWAEIRNLQSMGDARKRTLNDRNFEPTKGQKDNKWIDKSNADLPDFTGDDVDWGKFYLEFHKGFQTMAANKGAFEDNKKVREFFEEYYGMGLLFQEPPVDSATVVEINKLIDFLSDNETGKQIFSNIAYQNEGFEDKFQKIKDGKYKTDPTLKSFLGRISEHISHQINYGEFSKVVAQANPETQQAIRQIRFNEIRDGLNKETSAPPLNIEYFKIRYTELIEQVYSSEDIRKSFPNDKITKPIDTGMGNTNWKEGDNKIVPKSFKDADKNLLESVKDGYDEKYNATIGKLTKRHNRHLYVSGGAKHIMGAVLKKGITPDKGLEEVLKESKAIEASIAEKSPDAAKQFKWMCDTLETLKNGGMGLAFKDALSNRARLNVLVKEMAMEAADSGKMDEFKAAAEALSQMRYGLFDSKGYDKFASTEFDPLKDTTFMTNKTLAPIFKGATWGVNMVLRGAYKGITAGINSIKSRDVKVKINKEAFDEFRKSDTAKRNNFKNTRDIINSQIGDVDARNQSIGRIIKVNNARIDINNREMQELNASVGFDIDAKVQEYDQLRKDIHQLESKIRDWKSQRDELINGNHSNGNEAYESLSAQLDHARTDLLALNNSFNDISDEINPHIDEIHSYFEKKANTSERSQQSENLIAEKAENELLQDTMRANLSKNSEKEDKFEKEESKMERFNELMYFWDYVNGAGDVTDWMMFRTANNKKDAIKNRNEIFKQHFARKTNRDYV